MGRITNDNLGGVTVFFYIKTKIKRSDGMDSAITDAHEIDQVG